MWQVIKLQNEFFKASHAGSSGSTSGCSRRMHFLFVVSLLFMPHADLSWVSSAGEGNLDLGNCVSIKWKHFMIYWWKTVTFLLELLHCFWCNFRQRTWLIILRVTNSACVLLHCLWRQRGPVGAWGCAGKVWNQQGPKPIGVLNLSQWKDFQSAAKPMPCKWLSQPAAAPGFGVRGTMCLGESCCIQALSLESLRDDQGFLKEMEAPFILLFYFVFILCFEFLCSFLHKEPNPTLLF